MIRPFFALLTLLVTAWGATFAVAQSVQSARPIKINTIVTQDDFVLIDAAIPGAFGRIEDTVGLETKRTLYPGRPVMVGDLGPITIVDRNQLVQLVFSLGGLEITADGRALGRATLGQRVRVMNSDTRLVVTGVVISPTTVEVQN